MHRFTGEYECKVDPKGRVRVPSTLVQQLGTSANSSLIVNRGFEQHLILYPNEVWNKKTKEMDQLNIYNAKMRQALRYFYRGATEVNLDTNFRILIPKSLLEYGEIEEDVVFFAYQEQIEIWSKKHYEAMIAQEPVDFASIAEDLFNPIIPPQ